MVKWDYYQHDKTNTRLHFQKSTPSINPHIRQVKNFPFPQIHFDYRIWAKAAAPIAIPRTKPPFANRLSPELLKIGNEEVVEATVDAALEFVDLIMVVGTGVTVFDLVTTDLGGTTDALLDFDTEVLDFLVDDLVWDLVEDLGVDLVMGFVVDDTGFDDTCELGAEETTLE